MPMRSATIFERVHSGLATAPPYVFTVGVPVLGLVVVGLWWLWPTLSVVAGLILLLGFGSHIAWLRRRVRELADRDPLTGVASRACFLDELHRAVVRGNRSDTLSAAVLDCDDFKSVNEQHGHAVGDAVLIEVADVLSQTVGHGGTVGRIWGDAFGILLPGFTMEKARSLLREAEERLQARMSAHCWPVTFSIGVSCQGELITTASDLLADADALMFAVKRGGRNGIACRGLQDERSAGTDEPSPEFARQP
ncbi:MAG TPA: GGDEF domain-containing protein [Planctomycetaceae bacterium]|jgi:diguanylate cyclase (GGDEF)-like protein|nr:GGDEF domain-containing protein [Planctomycetaceae bacterium]